MPINIHIQTENAELAQHEMLKFLEGSATFKNILALAAIAKAREDLTGGVVAEAPTQPTVPASDVAEQPVASQTDVEVAPGPTGEPAEKPTSYRAKNAEGIRDDLLAKIAANQPLDANDHDDIPRLPKKAQEAVKAALLDATQTGVEPSSEPSGETAETLTYDVLNDDGSVFAVLATAAEWIETMVQRLGDSSDKEEIDKLAQLNRPVVAQLQSEGTPAEDFAAVSEAYNVAVEKVTGGEDPAEEKPAEEKPNDEEPAVMSALNAPTVEDARAAGMRLAESEGHGYEALSTLMAKYGAENFSGADGNKGLPADKIGDFITDVEGLIGKADGASILA